jgi:hypothetical protein
MPNMALGWVGWSVDIIPLLGEDVVTSLVCIYEFMRLPSCSMLVM